MGLSCGRAAEAHLRVAVATLYYPCETFGPRHYECAIVSPTPRIVDGALYYESNPRLGAEIDWSVVERRHVDN